mmetsp:Transcript_23116/g.54656  ORF Transcript_23116/g.54656 Transcript_23116/m.54656 type:complete len:116 (+) Transcript_23116:49-396(+)
MVFDPVALYVSKHNITKILCNHGRFLNVEQILPYFRRRRKQKDVADIVRCLSTKLIKFCSIQHGFDLIDNFRFKRYQKENSLKNHIEKWYTISQKNVLEFEKFTLQEYSARRIIA